MYLGERGRHLGKSLCNPAIQSSPMCLVERSDTSHSIYLRAAFMTAFALHPEAIIRGWLL